MIRGAEAAVLIITCPSRQVLTLTLRVPRKETSSNIFQFCYKNDEA
jgi:hypothetical protein